MFRQAQIERLGLHYDNNILAFKLLNSLNLSSQAHLAVFEGFDETNEDLLQQTIDCLTAIVSGKNTFEISSVDKVEVDQDEVKLNINT